MTQEEKSLLLKDLSTRLPYGVICSTPKGDGHLCSINQTIFGTEYGVNIKATSRDYFNDREVCIKPYLRPMSSMTDEEENEYNILNVYEKGMFPHTEEAFDWLNAHHFDYRRLIGEGLAIEAPENMYKKI